MTLSPHVSLQIGKTAMERAIREKHMEVVELLQQYTH